jgi:hypothetical protein
MDVMKRVYESTINFQGLGKMHVPPFNGFQGLGKGSIIFPMSGSRQRRRAYYFPRVGKIRSKSSKQWKLFVNKLLNFFDAWGRKSLGEIIRDGWKATLADPPKLSYPWSDEIQAEIERPDAVRVCHRCLTPQEHLGWFCPECGAATGPYNNCMPFVYIFSQGEVLRAGVNEKMKFARWVYPAYFLAGFCAFFIFAPIYWVWLIRAQIKRTEHFLSTGHDDSI